MLTDDRQAGEETPLLQRKSRLPLPWSQFNLVFVVLIAEPIASSYIFPFINQLISELGITGGDDRKIGYYAGLIESFFFATQALTTWPWSRLSDFIGRRSIILIGLLGLSVSNFAFGLSRTLGTLIISRCIAGIFNENIGVMNMLGDLTDHTNMAQVFPLVPPILSFGATIAPLFGGALAKPQERWPRVFHGEFWATYPYLLPCFVSGCFTLLTFCICAIFLKESLPSKAGKTPRIEGPIPENNPSLDGGEQPVSISALLKMRSVMTPVANYVTLGLVQIGFDSLLPLFYSSPTEIGGLGFTPAIIGTYLAIFGILNGTIQVLFATKFIKWFGAKKVFCWAVIWLFPLILLFPIMSAVVMAQGKVGPIIWTLVVVQLIFTVFMELSYTVIFMFVTRAAPNKRSMGSVNGLGQSLMFVARAIGPALTTSLFAASKQYNVLGGNLVYVVLAMLATVLVVLSRHLPDLKDEA